MRRTLSLFAAAAGLLLASAGSVRADVIELVGGRSVHGRILEGPSTDESLAVEMFDTGGVVFVKWDHIVPARAKSLRIELGIDLPDDDEVMVEGHRVLLTSGEVLEGRALNPDEKDKPLQIKTRTSVQPIDRPNVASVIPIRLPGTYVFTPEELYTQLLNENPPQSAAANMDLALKCMRIGALSAAQQHLATAKADAEFVETSEGRRIPQVEKQLELMVKSRGAQEIVTRIRVAMRANRWNDALSLIVSLDEQYKDEQVRRQVKFDLLESTVVRGRDTWFRTKLFPKADATMKRLVKDKVSEKKSVRDDATQPRGVAAPGTLASARQWASRELSTQIDEKLMADFGLKPEELERYWKERTVSNALTANYLTGSFIVLKTKQSAQQRPGQDPNRQRRVVPGQGGQAGPQRQVKEDRPKTDEEWWESMTTAVRSSWLIAWYVETGGKFTPVRTDENEICDGCGGLGVKIGSNADGSQSTSVCTTCNGSTKFKKVYYR